MTGNTLDNAKPSKVNEPDWYLVFGVYLLVLDTLLYLVYYY